MSTLRIKLRTLFPFPPPSQFIEFWRYAGTDCFFWFDEARGPQEDQGPGLRPYTDLGIIRYHRVRDVVPDFEQHLKDVYVSRRPGASVIYTQQVGGRGAGWWGGGWVIGGEGDFTPASTRGLHTTHDGDVAMPSQGMDLPGSAERLHAPALPTVVHPQSPAEPEE